MADADLATSIDLSLQEVIYRGLDALVAAGRLDLAAYLHAGGEDGPQLFLATPTLAQMTPGEAFTLFSALRDALTSRVAPRHFGDSDGIDNGNAAAAAPDGDDRGAAGAELVVMGRFDAHVVVTRGAHSVGMHALARLDPPLGVEERDVVGPLAAALGAVTHRIDSAARRARR